MTALKPIIAIDGPAGSGKSTIAKLVAKKLGLFYIDTGAMYRALALKAQHSGVDPQDKEKLVRLAENIDIKMEHDQTTGSLKVFLDGKDVSGDIRNPAITQHVSLIAKIKEVRNHMVFLQRRLAEGKRAILEGRDTTTVVFPDAYKKFYLDAQPEERVKRRTLEMKEKKVAISATEIKKDIEQRDMLDSTREHSPLTRAADAIYIDTTPLSIEDVVELVIHETQKPS